MQDKTLERKWTPLKIMWREKPNSKTMDRAKEKAKDAVEDERRSLANICLFSIQSFLYFTLSRQLSLNF